MKDTSFRSRASFGKRIEYYLIGKMLKEGLDLFIPMIDDDAIDVVVKRPDGKYVEVQIKARSKNIIQKNAALFAAIEHQPRKNYWFVFYSEWMDKMWIMSSNEFLKEAYKNKGGENSGKYRIHLNKDSNKTPLTPKAKFEKYIAENFDKIRDRNPNLKAK